MSRVKVLFGTKNVLIQHSVREQGGTVRSFTHDSELVSYSLNDATYKTADPAASPAWRAGDARIFAPCHRFKTATLLTTPHHQIHFRGPRPAKRCTGPSAAKTKNVNVLDALKSMTVERKLLHTGADFSLSALRVSAKTSLPPARADRRFLLVVSGSGSALVGGKVMPLSVNQIINANETAPTVITPNGVLGILVVEPVD